MVVYGAKRTVSEEMAVLSCLVASAHPSNPPLLQWVRPAIGDTRQVFDVTANELGEMTLLLSDRSECLAAAQAEALYNHETPAQLAKHTARIPPGGYLAASWIRETAAQASADKFVFLARAADGRQICRWQSKPTVPNRIVARGQTSYPVAGVTTRFHVGHH